MNGGYSGFCVVAVLTAYAVGVSNVGHAGGGVVGEVEITQRHRGTKD